MTLTDLLPAEPDPDAVFTTFAGWAKQHGLELYPHQEEALIEVVSGANVILQHADRLGQEPGRHGSALQRAR